MNATRTDVAVLLRDVAGSLESTSPVDAEDAYRRSLVLAPNVACAHAGIARALFDLDRYSEADGHLRRALAVEPQHDEALRLRAAYLLAEGRVPEALDTHAVAFESGAKGGATTAGFADLLSRLGLRADAVAAYRSALEREEMAEAHANLALLLVDARQLDEALAHLDRAATLDSGDLTIRLNRANVLVELGRLDEADDQYRALLADPSVGGAASLGLAAVHDAAGRCDEARVARVAAVTHTPELARRCTPRQTPMGV